MEAPDVYGKITDLGSTDFGFHIDELLNISNEEIAGPIGDDDNNNNNNNNSSSDNTKWAGNSPSRGNYETEQHYTLTCSDDLAELEWLSHFVEDSFSMHDGAPEPPNNNNSNNIEEIGSSAGPETCGSAVPVRARSKRPRRGPVSHWNNSHVFFFNARHPNISSSLSANDNGPNDQCRGAAEIPIPAKKFATELKKTEEENGHRRCRHCGIQRTPQWRAGPSGPKTLCNACGVRFKSGRLFPEYRPAASPTFVLSQHSNSHKRVLQMRRQKLESPGDPILTGGFSR